MSALLWWGYRHTNGGVQAKRWHPSYGAAELQDARESDFCAQVVGPFQADGRDAALDIVRAKTA